jgi:hypothetical protein
MQPNLRLREFWPEARRQAVRASASTQMRVATAASASDCYW